MKTKNILLLVIFSLCLLLAGCDALGLGAQGEASESVSTLPGGEGQPQSPSYVSGINALEQKDWSEAIRLFTHAALNEPENAEIYYYRGTAYYRRYESAFQANDPAADGEDFWRAITDFTKAIELNHNYVEAYHFRALTYAGLGQQHHALADYETAITLNPELDYPYYGRALIHEEQGRIEEAIADYERFLELTTDPFWEEEAQKHLDGLRETTP
jgi:tetratricopeptide (TPR) repeat protein